MDIHSGLPQAAVAGPALYPWERGVAIAELQELLNAHGFRLRIDGDFGYITEAAVKEFQRQHGLRIDGIVGAKTWLFLKSTLEGGMRPLHKGNSGSDVWELQGLLQVAGYEICRTGVFDAETHHALVTFQQQHKLKDEGIVDSITWRVLRGKPLPSQPTTKPGRWFLNVRRWW